MLIDYGMQTVTGPQGSFTERVLHDVTAEDLLFEVVANGQRYVSRCHRVAGQPYDACALIHAGAPCGSGAVVSVDPATHNDLVHAGGVLIGVFHS